MFVSLAKVDEKFAYWNIRSIHCNNFGDNYCIIILSYLRLHADTGLLACLSRSFYFFFFFVPLVPFVRAFARLAYAWHEIIMNYSFCWANIFYVFSHKFRLVQGEIERKSMRSFRQRINDLLMWNMENVVHFENNCFWSQINVD